MDSSYAALLGHRSLMALQGEEWKMMRQRLNPAFSKGHLISLMPCILEHISPFLECLDGYCRSGADFPLQDPLAELTLGIMGSIVMNGNNNDSSEISRQHEITSVFRELYSTYSFDPNVPSWLTDPRAKWRRNQVGKKLTSLLQDTIRKVADRMNRVPAKGSPPINSRNIIALALADVENLTTETLDLVCDQLKFLLFAGFDTTIYLLGWLIYQLSITPRALKSVQDELESIFGPGTDPTIAKEKLLSSPADTLSCMRYTSSLIKETLRMYPPGATSRTVPSNSDAFLQMPDGSALRLDGLSLYSCHSMIHREEAVYGATKDVFMPERWLHPVDSSGVGTRVPPAAWRPFERGPRNCLGQELALVVSKLVLVFAARRYNFCKSGLGQVARDASNEPILNPHGQYEVESELYYARQFIPKPVDRMRMHVQFSSVTHSSECVQKLCLF
ncbi:cytochrome P450 monooxygenase [Aspergillus affinis]|uniref:cytochrome P450 monooxygenase n=1 Tax=Aspergillus affinis TaxID=1070780 RepID=UPI0022FDEC37|nr:cytochrome P450 monooxygenase [Aspergillus affinis]KAI9038563.1 cytochrome P450 monooxygenase [Aspergillus affinis]